VTAQAGTTNAKVKVKVKVKSGYRRPPASSATLRAASHPAQPAATPARNTNQDRAETTAPAAEPGKPGTTAQRAPEPRHSLA